MEWSQIVEKVSNYVVKIETQSGHGTGFICFSNDSKTLYGIATASHVVEDAESWKQPIKITQETTRKFQFLQDSERVIFLDNNKDSALILVPNKDIEFPEDLIQLYPRDKTLGLGIEVGWLGYPGIAANTLCFFSGNISAAQPNQNAYLIDGVAINGVSGGPVFHSTGTEGVQFVGTVSAYRPNFNVSGALPGLLIAQDVSHFHTSIKVVRTITEAQNKKAELQLESSV